jgi:hypothetical protein
MMRTFKDKTGYRWTLIIDAAAIDRIARESQAKAAEGCEVWDLREFTGCFERSRDDNIGVFFELLCHVVRPWESELALTAQQFAERMTDASGLLLLRARREFWREWAAFFPGHDQRRAMLLKQVDYDYAVTARYQQQQRR